MSAKVIFSTSFTLVRTTAPLAVFMIMVVGCCAQSDVAPSRMVARRDIFFILSNLNVEGVWVLELQHDLGGEGAYLHDKDACAECGAVEPELSVADRRDGQAASVGGIYAGGDALGDAAYQSTIILHDAGERLCLAGGDGVGHVAKPYFGNIGNLYLEGFGRIRLDDECAAGNCHNRFCLKENGYCLSSQRLHLHTLVGSIHAEEAYLLQVCHTGLGAGAVGLPDVHDLFLGLGVQYAEEQRCQKKGLSHNLKLEILQYGYGKAACQRAAATGSASRQGVPFQALPTPLI